MKEYLKPECEIAKFTSEDILVVSGIGTGLLDDADYEDVLNGPTS